MKNTTVKHIFSLIGMHKFLLAISILLNIVSVAASLYIPILVGNAIDLLIGKGNVDFKSVVAIIIKIAATALASALAQWISGLINNKITYNVIRDIRKKAFLKISKVPLSIIDTHKTGDILSRVISDVDTFADGLLMGFKQLFSGVLTIIGTLILMLSINRKISLIVILATPVSLLVARFIANSTHDMFMLLSKTKGEQTGFIDEIIENQKTIKAFAAEEETEKTFNEINERLRKYSLKAIFFSSMVNPSTRVVNAAIYASVCLFGAISVINNPLFTVGALTALLSYSSQYANPFNEISGVISELQNSYVCAKRTFEFIDMPEEVSDESMQTLPASKGAVSFKNVDFSYSADKPLIKNLNLEVLPGQRVAIVGPTGSGKTTLINLLMRFYDVTKGTIKVDGVDITKITRESLRENYGMVLQETWLKKGTIRDNITFGCPNATEEEIIAAAKATHAHSFIKRLPEKYDTLIDEGGGNLSEGQKQLLCITRVMLSPPPILILDEATSSIDVMTEMYVNSSFKKLMKCRTSFVVAHRLSTIRESDIILVLKDGNIIEKGNHLELLNKKGFYYDLYNSQFAK